MDTKAIIDRVKKLRSLATSSNVHEAANASAAAERLIQQFRLTEAELQDESNQEIIEGDDYLYETGKVVQWKMSLARYLAELYGVYLFNDTNRSETGRQITRIKMVGKRTDIELLFYSFHALINEITRLCDKNVVSHNRGVSVERNSYCLGAVHGIVVKMQEEKAEVAKTTTSTALVALNNRQKEAERWAFQEHDIRRVKAHNSQASISGNSYNSGLQAGKNITLRAGLKG
ncbi:MAG TPA: DUF2786 domain-containing protein [Ignavibacteriaceae bacterium]|nr:DUF2786 domain-containing protein [Ignavibacteriaceae bacterium]